LYSSVLSILTAVFEIIAAVIAFKTKGRKSIRFTSAFLLLLLASYQILEILICSISQNNLFFSKLAFVTIVWLPPLGVLLISFLFPYKRKLILKYSLFLFGMSLLTVIWILFTQDFVKQTVCSVVFAYFSHPKFIYFAYSVLYQLGLFSMLILTAIGVMNSEEEQQRKQLGQFLLGAIAFIFPAMLTVIVVPATEGALPSIMCHYALFLAIFICRLIYFENRFTNERHEMTLKKET